MKSTSDINSVIAVISFFAIILLFNLNNFEIQPWDEGLYAVRAKAILQFDCWLDQSEYSAGGLYSSTYPPLSVWFITISMYIFGENPFTVRLFSVLCSLLTLVLIYNISRKVLSSENSLIAVLLLGTSLAFNHYSRQAMTDIPLTFFIVLCFWASIKLIDAGNLKSIIVWSSVFGLSFASALMTKIVISFLPLLFALAVIIFTRNLKKSIFIILFSLIGISIALPWHLYMMKNHGSVFYNAFFVPHIYSSVENNTPQLGMLYYINQLIISNPIIILSMISIFFINKHIKIQGIDKIGLYVLSILLFWFYGLLFIFSISITKLPHYVVYFLPVAILIGTLFYTNINKYFKSKRIQTLFILFLILVTIWSFSYSIRQSVKLAIVDGNHSHNLLIFALLGIFIVSSIFLIKDKHIAILSKFLLNGYLWGIIIALCLRFVLINSFLMEDLSTGAEKTAKFLNSNEKKSFVYLFHKFNSGDTLNPQLGWYSNGWTYGWQKDKNHYNIPLQFNYLNINEIRDINKYPDLPVVYYISKDKYLANTVVREVAETRIILYHFGNYVIFSSKKNFKISGINI